MAAQRRPGRQPRRHRRRARRSIARPQPSLNEGRGVSPGDTGAAVAPHRPFGPAQRRPGRQPRRHADSSVSFVRWTADRSTKAGASAPATPADAFTVGAYVGSIAQRRPGRQPRRHGPSRVCRDGQNHSAQRRPGRQPRRHGIRPAKGMRTVRRRSTKAGASAPATPPARIPGYRRSRRTLNEGRGVSPGDTGYGKRCRTRPVATLNEGRGVSPGDTPRPQR